MNETLRKGDLGVAKITADLMFKGWKIARPIGEDWPFDLILYRDNGFERIQCKYLESNGEVIPVKCRSTSEWGEYKYTIECVDWLAAYDKTTDCCYYIPSHLLGKGMSTFSLRLKPSKNGQTTGIRFAKDFLVV